MPRVSPGVVSAARGVRAAPQDMQQFPETPRVLAQGLLIPE